MALAPILAAALTTPATRAKTLTVGGVDVLRQPGTTGNAYGVPIETVSIDWQGPGAVSAMSFRIEDPAAALTLPSAGDEVVLWDLTANTPLFGGFVSSWTVMPMTSGQGRTIDVECNGYEIILDWSQVLAPLTLPASTKFQDAVLVIAASAEGANVRAFGAATYITKSSQSGPVSGFNNAFLQYDVTIPAGTTLREALRLASLAAGINSRTGPNTTPSTPQFTVDFWRGLRGMENSASGTWATDYTTLTVTDTYAGANPAEGLRDETDAAQIVRGIYIKGASAAASGYMSDGTGLPGRIAYMADSTIDTAAKLADAQIAYLNDSTTVKRGTFRLTDWAPPSGVQVGSLVSLTDAATGATGTYRLMGVQRTFHPSGRETWDIRYGRQRPSGIRLLRRLTRGTLS